ncbi:hypothetical protein ACE6H2_016849 [Prunus campanulata]
MRRMKREGGGKVERPIQLLEETYFGVEMRGRGGKILGPKGTLRSLNYFLTLQEPADFANNERIQCDELVHADPHEVMGQLCRQQLYCLIRGFLIKTSSKPAPAAVVANEALRAHEEVVRTQCNLKR